MSSRRRDPAWSTSNASCSIARAGLSPCNPLEKGAGGARMKLVKDGMLEKAKFGSKTLFTPESVQRSNANAVLAGKI